MGKPCLFIFLFDLLLTATVAGVVAISREDFPPGFIFGAGTSAYQVEGAAAEDGRKPSIWDTFAHAGKSLDNKTGDIAADQYHKYKEDVELMHQMGLDAYRFSISWSRLIPDGRGPVNPKGLQYYNNLIDELVNHGIQAHVTLSHFDLPQALQDEYGGLLSPRIVEDFTAYANVCFKEFGDRVKYWITFNEPSIQAITGYDIGIFPPSRCSYPFGRYCSSGDSTTEPYIAAHNMLLSHASAANLYKEEYQANQHGYIGITLEGWWLEPMTTSTEDIAAAQRARDFQIGWILDPLTRGTYPEVMRKIVGSRLPNISVDVSEQLKRSYDFIGLNHYETLYVKDWPGDLEKSKRDYWRDISAKIPGLNGGEDVDPVHQFGKPTPWALQRLLEYIKLNYANPPIMIHENGYGEYDDMSISNDEHDDLHDPDRVECLQAYIDNLLLSIRNGSNTTGYFVWSLVDLFETMFGYTARFGLYKVDFNDPDRKRYPRSSARWYSNFLKGGAPEIGKLSSFYSQ